MRSNKNVRNKFLVSMLNIAILISIFSGMSILLLTFIAPNVSAAGDTIYVGKGPIGPGENNTDSIEEAVEDLANNGDTVCVWPGTYYENPIEMSNTITLESIEGRDTTTIDAQGSGTVITVSASWCN